MSVDLNGLDCQQRSAVQDPAPILVTGPYATLWRVEMHDLPAQDVATTDPSRLAALLHAVLELHGPAALADWLPLATGATSGDASHTIEGTVSELWRARSPAIREVLQAIASAHPNRHVAKAARKALFKLRTSGGTSI